jgi:hypothetical protein
MNCCLSRFIPRSQRTQFNRGRRAATDPAGSVFFVVLFAMLVGSSAFAQQAMPVERVYKSPRVEVERALRDLQVYTTAPLPALDGFVNSDSSTFDLYENPQYEFRVKLVEQAPEQMLVSVSARITAWNPNAVPPQSRYVLLPSNGRLERELLDHLAAYLEKGSLRQPSGSRSAPTASVTGSTGSSPALSTTSVRPGGAADSALVKSADADAPFPALKNADPATLTAEITKARAEREAIQKEEEKLQQQIAQLESDRNSRTRISDLATIKTPQAPIFAEPTELSKVLFRADPEDEFEVTEARYGWVRIRLQNLAQGWIRISELQLPNEPDTGDSAAADFTEPSEEVAPFTGNWALLRDKPTLFVVAQPKHAIPKDSLGQSQVEFAKHAFLDGYRTAAHSQEKIVGVAVLFLGDKAGVAAATLTDIDRWQKGTLSDKLFLACCSLSPPDAFRDVAKH